MAKVARAVCILFKPQFVRLVAALDRAAHMLAGADFVGQYPAT